MFARVSIAALAVAALVQVVVPLWAQRDILATDLVEQERFPFELANAASGDVAPSTCMAALICTVTCPACRERASRPGAIDVEFILLGDADDAAEFSSSTDLPIDNVWLPGPVVLDGFRKVVVGGMSGTPTAVVIQKGILSQIHRPPTVPFGVELNALCVGDSQASSAR